MPTVKRKHVLIVAAGVVFIVALTLRIYSQRDRSDIHSAGNRQVAAQTVSIPVPQDYVANPKVESEEIDRGPERIISLAPNITEIVCALGMRDRLVGRTQYCTHPPDLESVPAVGAIMDTNLARIKSLQPHLVLTTTNSGPVIDNLRALDLPHLAVPHGSIADVYQAIALIGNRCDRSKTARRLISLIRSDIDALKMSARALNIVPKRLLVVLGSMPVPPKATFVAGPASFLDNLVEMAGHTNIAHEVLKDAYGEIPLENLRILDPEVILEFRDQPDTKQMDQLYGSWSEVGMLQAIQNRRVRSIGGSEWLSAGPRIAIELHRFITVLSEFR